MQSGRQTQSVKDVVTGYFESKGGLEDLSEADKLAYKYLDNRLIDSLGIIQMVATFESEFGIRFEPEHFESADFTTIGGVIKLVEGMLQDPERSVE